MNTEYVVLKGRKLVVHADKCKCAKRTRESFCAYGSTREEITYDINPFRESMEIEFAPCALKKLDANPLSDGVAK